MEAATKDVQRRGEGVGLSFVWWASAVLCNGLGRHKEALAAAQQASEDSPADLFANWAVIELIEAAARSAVPQLAAVALQWLSNSARTSGTDWALGVEARSRALLSDSQRAGPLYREAIDRLSCIRLRLELARAQPLSGEGLRRQNRRGAAPQQLRTAPHIPPPQRAGRLAPRAPPA